MLLIGAISTIASLLSLAKLGQAHGDHAALDHEAVDNRAYVEKHMSTEHHIDSFDLESFFALHDLDGNGFWDIPEIEAVYGLHHPEAQKSAPAEYQESKRKVVTDKVLKKLDRDGDGRVSMEEFLAGGIDGLPSFITFPDLGHHYDEESEYFLHHEEMYHSTPETQTDESYNHPEDIAHFAHHEHIEAEEEARERKFEGIDDDMPVSEDRPIDDPLDAYEQPAESAQKPLIPPRPPGSGASRPARIDRSKPKVNLEKARAAAEGLPGYGEHDFHRPRSAEERLRKGLPYKYKFGSRNEF